MASTLHLTPMQLAECWEAFSLNKNVSELTDHTFQSYRSQLIKDSETSSAVTKNSAVQSRGAKRQATNMVTPPTAKRPNQQQQRPEQTTTGASSVDSVGRNDLTSPRRAVKLPSYNDRTRVGQIVASFNPTGLPPIAPNTKSVNCVISQDDQNLRKSYRHMFTTMEERSRALEDHLTTLSNEIISLHGISDGENGIAPLEQVNVPRQDKVTCVGRICNEAHEGKLNATSVVIEGSSSTCGGARINVDLSMLKSSKTAYSLFPGQIVAIEGMNPTGRKLMAQRVCEGAAHPVNTASVKELREFHYDRQDGSPIKLLTACGPFTTSDNMDYEPFVDFMHVVMEQSPDVVILTGPFVDMRHDAVKKGNISIEVDEDVYQTVPHEAVFANKISSLIDEVLESMGDDTKTQFVLVPALEDASAKWVYPQAPMEDRLKKEKILDIPGGDAVEFGTLGLSRLQEGNPGRVHCLSNPCTFRINEVVFGVTSTDIICQISSEETNSHLEPGTRLRRIAQHVVQQRSFYPLFPPPVSAPTNLDLKHMHGWKMPCRPDVLVIPSKLTPFASTVLDSTVVLNPGHLTKGTTGGTYALMDIHPMKREKLDDTADDVHVQHSLNDRVNVEVKRI